MAKQNKNYSLYGRLERLLRPIYQLKWIEMNLYSYGEWNFFIQVNKVPKYSKYFIEFQYLSHEEPFHVKIVATTWRKAKKEFLLNIKNHYGKYGIKIY